MDLVLLIAFGLLGFFFVGMIVQAVTEKRWPKETAKLFFTVLAAVLLGTLLSLLV